MSKVMNREIEEMARLLDTVYDNQVDHDGYEDRIETATTLYEAGYRKQSDTVDDFADRLKAVWRVGKMPDEYISLDFLFWVIDGLLKEYGVEVE